MIVAALVLDETTRGIINLSQTRSASITFLPPTVEIRCERNARLLRCLNEDAGQGMRNSRADFERPLGAMMLASKRVVAFGAPKIWENFAVGPTATALFFCPDIIIARAAAGEHLRVD